MVVIGNDLLSIRQQNQEAGMIVWSHTLNWKIGTKIEVKPKKLIKLI